MVLNHETGIQTNPFRLTDWYDRQMEYRTASRFRSELMVRYNFDKGVYLRLDGSSLNGKIHPRLLPGEGKPVKDAGGYRLEAVLSLGLDF